MRLACRFWSLAKTILIQLACIIREVRDGGTPSPARETRALPILGNLAAPGKYLRLRAGRFGFLDVASAIVEQRKTCPTDLVVRPKLDRFFSCFNRFRKAPELHQRHPKSMPAVKKTRIHLNASPVFLDCALQLPDGQIAACVVKDFVARLQLLGITMSIYCLALRKLKTSIALPVVQPFVEHNLSFVIQDALFKRRSLFVITRIRRWLPFF